MPPPAWLEGEDSPFASEAKAQLAEKDAEIERLKREIDACVAHHARSGEMIEKALGQDQLDVEEEMYANFAASIRHLQAQLAEAGRKLNEWKEAANESIGYVLDSKQKRLAELVFAERNKKAHDLPPPAAGEGEGPKGVIGLSEAQRQNRCRICGNYAMASPGNPIILHFGSEYAHQQCLKPVPSPSPSGESGDWEAKVEACVSEIQCALLVWHELDVKSVRDAIRRHLPAPAPVQGERGTYEGLTAQQWAKAVDDADKVRQMQLDAERHNELNYATGLIVRCTGCERGQPFDGEHLTEERVVIVEQQLARRLRSWWNNHKYRTDRAASQEGT